LLLPRPHRGAKIFIFTRLSFTVGVRNTATPARGTGTCDDNVKLSPKITLSR
jgi:hypothetical protein